MTETQPNGSQVKQRSKKATTIAMEQIQDLAALSSDAVFGGAWSWPVKVCMRVITLPTSTQRDLLTIQSPGTATSFLSPFTPESHQATHNQVDHSHVRGHCGSVRRWLSSNCSSPSLLEWAVGLRNCCADHLRCRFCHWAFDLSCRLVIDRSRGFIR